MKTFGLLVLIIAINSCVYFDGKPLSDNALIPYAEDFNANEVQINILLEFLDSKRDNIYNTEKERWGDERLPDSISVLMNSLGICLMSKDINRLKNGECQGEVSFTLQVGEDYIEPFVYYIKDNCEYKIKEGRSVNVVPLKEHWILVSTGYDYFWD